MSILLRVILIFIMIVTIIACKNKSGQADEEILVTGKDTTRFNISPDSIGITIKEGIDEEHLKKLLSPEGFSLIRNILKEVYIIVSDKKKKIKREEVFEIARGLKNKFKDVISKAGYLAYPKGATVPVVVTDEIVIDFTDQVSKDQITGFINDNGMELAMQNPFIKTQHLVRLKDNTKGDALQVSRTLTRNNQLKYIHPNFIALKENRAIPDDPLFSDQWHHRNTGIAGGTVDADIDADLAWDFGFGSPSIIIAVIDDGYDMTHPDIVPNFNINTAEVDGNGIDDEGNGFIDDRIGWDFDGCAGLPCGDGLPEVADHGTATIGTAAARGRNTLGVAGSCPECGLIPIESGAAVFEDALSFGYAQSRGAKIISCSWGYTVGMPRTMAVETAINNVTAAGVTVFFAMPNRNRPYCFAVEPDISALPNVIAISRSTNRDRFDLSGYGDCLDLLAPSSYCETVSSGRGTLWTTTTDRQGIEGFNNASAGGPSCMCPLAEGDLDYTKCFNGTSFSTPLTAGVGGLILSADNSLTPRQVQNLLQDCADKIEHSQGQYVLTTGFSNPAVGDATHGFGRINAFEAVRVAAPVSIGGKGGIDIFFRDNNLDWGNTEQPSNVLFEPVRGFIPHWESVDIKVDAPPFAPTAPATSAAFDAFVDERALGGMTNKVYVRVHNRGYRSAASVNIKLHWVYAGLTFPALPPDFWTRFPLNATDIAIWHPLGTTMISSLGYSGCSVAGSPSDASQVAVFDFPAPMHDETLPNHYCLMALIDSPEDGLVTPSISASLNMDNVTPFTNNATHRNITIINMEAAMDASERFMMVNPFKFPITARIKAVNPNKVKYQLDDPKLEQFFTLNPNESRLIKLKLNTQGVKANAELRLEQVRQVKDDQANGGNINQVMGGITFRFVKKK